jgi:hypothetical protein
MFGWDPTVDEPFFRMVAYLFPRQFTFGAAVLLASYDEDDTPPQLRELSTVPAPRMAAEALRTAQF